MRPLDILSAALAFAFAAIPARASEGSDALIRQLEAARRTVPACGPESAALGATEARLRHTVLPTQGKLIVVNIPGQSLTAYENGAPILEMRVIVGKADRRTPELQSEVMFVRLNPTWTVPQSILAEPEWRDRLADPAFLSENGFEAYGPGGRRVASVPDGRVARLVQRPGEANPLGVMKMGLRGGDGIYLHGTNEPEAFDGDDPALSHGCVRVERPYDLAAWVMGTRADALQRLQAAGDQRGRVPANRVPVVLGYFTAWPDADGTVRFYTDIYGKDATATACSASMDSGATQ